MATTEFESIDAQFTVLGPALLTGNWPDDFGGRIGALEQGRDLVEAELDILSIRFEDGGPVAANYRAAWESVKSLISVYMASSGGRGSAEAQTEALKISEEFDACRTSYLDAARKTAALDL